VKLAKQNRVQLIQVPGHMGIDGNEIAHQLAREDSSCPLIGPKSALGISAKVVRGVIRDWTSRKQEEHWHSTCTQRSAKGFLKEPSVTKKSRNCSA
jgi:ribonuclease HI